MAFDLALFDLISPYVLLGDSFGSWHAVLSVIYVDEHTIAFDDGAIVIRGIARFSGEVHPFIDPSNMTFGVQAENVEGHPANDPGRRDPWIDIRDTHLDFELNAPRVASQKVSGAVAAIGGASGFAPTAAVFNAYDSNPADPAPSDYPSTEFTLDLVLTTIILRPPFLKPAKLLPSGQLVEDTTKANVAFTLPKIKARLAQGSGTNDPLTVQLLSLGATGLDDPGDLGVAQLVTMDPPYAFIGPSKTVGFGFRSATLDLSTGSTPVDVLSQFGFDESWTGLYLPEIRLFIAPHGADDLCVDAGARNLLIGFGASAGITGDFDLEIVDQGSGTLRLSARFYDNAGQSYAIAPPSTDHTSSVSVPARSRMIVDIDGGLAPYTSSITIDGGASQPGRVFDIDLSSNDTRTVVISAADSSTPAKNATLTITVNRRPSSAPQLPGTTADHSAPPAQIETTSVTQGGSPVETPKLKIVQENPSSVIVGLDATPPPAAHWTVGGVDQGAPSTTVSIGLAAGASVDVQADVAGASGVTDLTTYYRFDHPVPGSDADVRAYAEITDGPNSVRSTNSSPAPDEGLSSSWPAGADAATALIPLLNAFPDHTPVTIDVKGYASFETGGNTALTYNTALALRRAQGLAAIIDDNKGAKPITTNATADMSHWNAADQGDPVRNQFWKAVASWPPQNMPGTTTIGRVSRDPLGDPPAPRPVPDNPTSATPPPPPSWFKQVGAKVRIVRNQFVACEIDGKFDIQTPAENQLRNGGVSDSAMPAARRLGSNPADGIIDVRLVIQIDDATDTVTISGYFGADPADRDGLQMWGALPDEPLAAPNLGRNYLGMAIVFMPLLSAASSAVANDGALAEIVVTGAVLALPMTLASMGWITVERVIWYGGEIDVQLRPDGTQVVVLLDLETAVSLDLQIGSLSLIKIERARPLKVRYKAIGVMIGNPPGQPKFQFRPMFDSSKGYTIDVSGPGAITVADPLGQILKILGARIARNNPLTFEVDLGFAVDLGVVSIERARVRMKLDPVGPPELTAFAASIDIPAALKGRGYLELNEHEIKGQIDLTITPVSVRVAAGLGIANIPPDKGGPATGVIVTLQVEFPVAIPLANSGLGIYGFIGLFAMNYSRDESSISGSTTPALAWLKATGGDPTNIAFWTPTPNTWAFGVGAILGTMGSSVIFNLKGVILLELPGPRLLLMMKANLLKVMPDMKGSTEGTFLAVIDLDFGRGTLTIGLQIDFNVDPLLRLMIPVEAFFDFNDTSNWHLYVGQYINQVQAKVLQVFDASGYLMLAGNGLSGISTLPAVTGFSIATGLHVSFKWGGGPLYVEVSAGFDAIIGFSPFRMAGILTLRGTLHLFIIDISAWADLHVDVGDDGAGGHVSKIEGDVCGKVSFFFFDIEGCITFSLGDPAVPIPDPPNLAKTLKLISRSPALVMGTGVDKPIDSGIGDGKEGAANPGGLPVVPIDAIPLLMMEMPPLQDPALKFLGQNIGGTPEAPADGWVQRGDVYFQYTIKNIELIGPVTAGNTPATWWKSKSGDKALDAQLALLSWVPEATPKALGSSQYLDETVKEQWGTVCWPAAAPAPVLYTFLQQLLGPSINGWNLTGQPWPDSSNTVRSTPPDTNLQVIERWRCGNSTIDALRGVVPAQVEGMNVACPQKAVPGAPGLTTAAAADARLNSSATAVITRGIPAFNNPITAIRGGLGLEKVVAGEQLSLADTVARFNSNVPVGRASMINMTLTAGAGPAVAGGTCYARALASPIFDDGQLVAFGNDSRAALVKQEWAKRRFKPGPLDDAVVFQTGAFAYARFYLWVPLRLLQTSYLVVAACDAKDTLLSQHIVVPQDHIPPQTFPASWTSTSGPWHDDVLLVSEMGGAEKNYTGVFVTIKGVAGADRIMIGCLPNSRQIREAFTLRPFYVAALELLRRSEQLRFDYDTTEQTKKQGVLEDALGLDSADNALLQQGQTYQVRITWDANRQRRPGGGNPPTDQKSVAGKQQSFWFQTDANPPARLDPWVLVGLPGEGEKHFFASDAVKVVFATSNLSLVYGAYGKKLQARLRPASYRPVPSTPTVPHPFPIDATTLKPVKAAVLSPWEDAVAALVDGTCVPVSGERTRHTMITIPIPLDLYTDYVLDIEMVDTSAADGTPGVRVWRESFSTGGFRLLDDFANSFQIARVAHRGVPADHLGGFAAIAATYATRDPQGAELDTDLSNTAGLDAQPVASAPRSIVFWEPGAPDPQPVAIMLDSSEPMWRSRPIPTEVNDADPAGAKHYEMISTPWLDVVQQAGGDDIVDHIVRAPGGQRAIITLKANSRGKHLKVALRRIALTAPYLDGAAATDQLYTVLDLTLTNAPWEEVD